jgi:hypothetical protein
MAAALGAAIVANSGKLAQIAGAVSSLDAQGWTWFGLTCEGGGRRNSISIANGTSHDIELVRTYIHWGKCKVPAEAYVKSMEQDDCLFHNCGSWAATGSSGILTYKLQHETNLHIMWDCPFNFDYSDNFIGLMLTSKPEQLMPDQMLFKNMYQDWHEMGLTPKKESSYDLVCCGPSKGDSKEAGGTKPWGFSRPCKVQDDHYTVYATMGDRHATSSKIVIVNK